MSHIVSLRSASLRALRSTSTASSAVLAATKCTTYSQRSIGQQQQYSYSTLPPTPTGILTRERQRTLSEQTLVIDSSNAGLYALTRHLHTSPILFDSVSVSTPSFPESVKDGTIRLLKKVGDKVSADETIAEIETDKTNLSVNAPQGGVIESFSVTDGDNVTSGAVIGKIDTSGSGTKPTSATADAKAKAAEKADAEKNKEESAKQSSDTSGPAPSKTPSVPATPKGPQRETPTSQISVTPAKQQAVGGGGDPNKISGTRSETRVKMSRMRLKIAERLKEAQNTCAMLTTFNEIDMSNLVEFRKKYADQFLKRHNMKLGFMSAFVKASACALVDNPIVNAVIDGNEIVYRDYVDISVAVAAPKGLVVPVVDVACLKNLDSSMHAMPNLNQIHALIEHYGPTVYFHPDEVYMPSSVSWFFKNGALLYAAGNAKGKAIDYHGSNLPSGGYSDYAFWIDLPTDEDARNNLKKGNIESAELYVHVKPALGGAFTDIAMWVFCPFNGPATLKVSWMNIEMSKIGEHVGDWEHFTLRVSNFTGELCSVFFSEHSGGKWVNAFDLEFIKENKPIVYSSRHGHASYPHSGTYLQGSSKLGIGVRNDAAKSNFIVDSSVRYKIVAAEYLGDGVITEPCWLQYMREWGPTIVYDSRSEIEKIIDMLPIFVRFSVENLFELFPTELYGEEGPTGPKEKDNWLGDEYC